MTIEDRMKSATTEKERVTICRNVIAEALEKLEGLSSQSERIEMYGNARFALGYLVAATEGRI